VKDLDETLEQTTVARDSDSPALDRLGGLELAVQQGKERQIGFEDEIRLLERSLADLEPTVGNARVDDDGAQAQLVARAQLPRRLGPEGRAQPRTAESPS
jgi:hypothetical protein